jgi:hypothetical protein
MNSLIEHNYCTNQLPLKSLEQKKTNMQLLPYLYLNEIRKIPKIDIIFFFFF